MFYIRERRLWIWLRDGDGGVDGIKGADGAPGSTALMAMSTQRKTLDFEHEFNDMKTRLAQLA